MQKENISFNPLITATSAAAAGVAPPRFSSSNNPFLSPIVPVNCPNTNSSYYPLFQNYSPNSISDAASFDGGDTERSLHDASSVLEYQQLYNRYALCLSQLHDSIDEVEDLRLENESLRLSNADLSRRVALLFTRDRLLSEFNRLSITSPSAAAAPPIPVHVAPPPPPRTLSENNLRIQPPPRPLSENNRLEPKSTERVSLPKSISVRSRGYLKMTRQKTVSQPCPDLQRVCVPGAKKEEEALEFDVYNQGMMKTELCNKWQETGTCPYGENCQFAHGVKELRPVIRHPRYKTEVCRMVLAGDICPYGHRCHFRHALTEEERLVAASSLPPPPR
ncbi:hypothetical protein ABFS83_08G068800 [Erythranthe nasuta]